VNLIKHVTDPDRLLLVWQAPEEGKSRTRFVVGELRQHEGQVVFRYLPDTDEFKKLVRKVLSAIRLSGRPVRNTPKAYWILFFAVYRPESEGILVSI